MRAVPSGRVARAAAWTASLSLVTLSVVGVAGGPAGAATAKTGALRLCANSSLTRTVSFTIHGSHYAATKHLRTRAHHTVCASALRVRQGAFTVTEHVAGGTHVSRIGVSPHNWRMTSSTSSALVRVKVYNRHTTTAGFTNAITARSGTHPVKSPKPVHAPVAPTPAPPPSTPSAPGTGYLEVCKQAGDSFVTGTVTVKVTAGSFSASQPVPVGQCTGALQVPAGNVTVSETVAAPYYLGGVKTNPAAALVSVSPTTNSAVVRVAPSADGSVETTAWLINKTHLGYWKICKTLTSNAGDLIASGNNTFTYDVSYTAANQTPFVGKVNIVVPSLNQAACVLSPTEIPLGTKVTITEEHKANTTLQSITVLPAAQQVSQSGSTVVIAIGPNPDGTVTTTFVNSADGTIEICKRINDRTWYAQQDSRYGSPYNGTPFQFSINGGAPITVRAGACSPGLSVPAGTATVQELPTPYFNLVGFTATGPDGSSRLLSGTNPITVAVPAGGVGNETLVIATNKVQMAQLKICKMIDTAPVGKSYNFTTKWTIGGHSYTDGTVWLKPTAQGPSGEVCSYLSHPLPIIDGWGHMLSATVYEGASPFGTTSGGQQLVAPTAIAYDGNGQLTASRTFQPGDPASTSYYGTATLGQGVNEMTFTNSLVLDP